MSTAIEKLPLVDEHRPGGGLITGKRSAAGTNRYGHAAETARAGCWSAAAIGVVRRLPGAGAGSAGRPAPTCWWWTSPTATPSMCSRRCASSRRLPRNGELIAGNVATAEGTRELVAAGVDAVKVGVGRALSAPRASSPASACRN